MIQTDIPNIPAVRLERRGYCKVCKRALKNPKWVELGIGPICAKRQGVTGGSVIQGPAARADYDIVRSDAESITIRDLDRGSKSVTNDAEAVVVEMLLKYGLGTRRLFYYDSSGRLDEIRHDGRAFLGFAPASQADPT